MLGSFIRNGGEREFINNNSFFQRESNAFSAMEETLKKKYSEEETDQIIQHVIGYMAVIQEIYFNLGVKAGAMLHCKLTDNFETDI